MCTIIHKCWCCMQSRNMADTQFPLIHVTAVQQVPKWRATTNPPKLLGVFVLVMALLGFGLGIRGLPWWIQVILALITATCLASLFLVTAVDPGVLEPKSTVDPVLAELLTNQSLPVLKDDGYLYTFCDSGKMEFLRWHGSNEQEKDKYCITCNIWRPPRAHHCSICGYCMERFDHHCGVVATCIAKNNHRFFVSFLLTAQAACVVISVGAVWRLEKMNFPSPTSWGEPEVYILLMLLTMNAYISLALLFGIFHCAGVLLDVTTKDILQSNSISQNPPCCSKRRSLLSLIKANAQVWCSPIRLRPRFPGATQAFLCNERIP